MPPVTTVWLCRHAETAYPHVFHGAESDVELGEHGKMQAIATAEWFADQKTTAVISSTMKRAIDTADVIAKRCGVPHHIKPNLHERRVGELGGTSFALAEGPWVETVKRWSQGEIDFTTPGAESYAELMARLIPAFEEAIKPFAGERVVVIAHGIVCKILLLSLLEGWGPGKWDELGKVSNLSVSEIERQHDLNWTARMLLHMPPQLLAVDEMRMKSA